VMRLIFFDVDKVKRSVTASYFGLLFHTTATYRPGMGCGLHLSTLPLFLGSRAVC
jgi:hypothetical protein